MTEIGLDLEILARVDGDDHRDSFPDLSRSPDLRPSREDARTQAVDCLAEAMRRRTADRAAAGVAGPDSIRTDPVAWVGRTGRGLEQRRA